MVIQGYLEIPRDLLAFRFGVLKERGANPPTSLERRASGNKQKRPFSHAVTQPQPSAISRQPSASSHQPAAISQQPAAISHQPPAVSHQPSAFSQQPAQPAASSQQPATTSHQPSATSHQPSAFSPQSSAVRISFFLGDSRPGLVSASIQ